MASHLHLPVLTAWVISLVASVIGLAGAKLYYAVSQYLQGERSPRELASGACIQGFVLCATASIIVGTANQRALPRTLGTVLDTTAPALLLGMAVGRWGCFLAGCCAGRPTASP